MEASQPKPVLPEFQEPHYSFEAPEAELAALNDELFADLTPLEAAYEASDPDTQARLDAIDQAYTAARRQAQEAHEPIPSYASFADGVDVPPIFREKIPAVSELMTKIDLKEAELEAHAPEKAKALAEKAAKIEASLDYGKLVELMETERNLYAGVNYIIGCRILLGEPQEPLPYSQLQGMEESIEESARQCEDRKLITSTPAEAPLDATSREALRTQIAEKLEATAATVDEVYDLTQKYKQENPDFTDKVANANYKIAVSKHAYRLVNDGKYTGVTLDELLGRGTPASTNLNPALETAMLNHQLQELDKVLDDDFELSTESDYYKKFVTKARAIYPPHAVDAIEVGGEFSDLPIHLSEAMIRNLLLENVPAIALQAVKRQELRPLTKKEDSQDSTFGFCEYDEDIGGLKIVTSTSMIKTIYAEHLEFFKAGDHPNPEEAATESLREELTRHFTHEYAHALHQALPVAALKRWEDQRASDPVRITSYVKSMFDKGHRHKHMEDFADSMGLFVATPQVLDVVSPVRYEAMRQIYDEYLLGYDVFLERHQKRQIAMSKFFRDQANISDQQIKEVYLSHEKEPIE